MKHSVSDSIKATRKILIGGLIVLSVGLAAWYTLDLISPTIADAPVPLPPSAVAFIPSASAEPTDIYFDLSHRSPSGPDLLATQAQLMNLEHGWSVAEDWGIWALGQSAAMRVYLDRPRDRTMLIRGWAPKHPQRQRQTITVRINGHDVGTTYISRRPRNRYVTIPASVQRPGENLIDFEFAFSSAPASAGFGSDTRALAVGFCSIGFGNGKQRVKPPSLRSELLAPIGRWFHGELPAADLDHSTGHIVVRRAGKIVAPISGQTNGGSLVFRVRAPGNPDPGSSIRSLTLTPLGSDSPLQLPFDLHRDPSADDLLTLETSIPAQLTMPAVLEVHIDPGTWTTSLQSPLFRPQFASVEGAEDSGIPLPSADNAATEGDRPDLIVITLDAARPDHFGCYGYQRPTTPNIDQLATGSVVFDSAFALAPYTLCSVPTMITGLSFLDHGVVSRGHRLSPKNTTLAETLIRLGYETACFTATPNNARSLGFDQGYTTFWEAWPGVDERQARDPARLSAAVVDWLKTVDENTPLHLQVHYVPPHEPYDPGPTFDIFGDPDYTGIIDGTLATIKAIDRGHQAPTGDDLERLISLYDGNLRRADSAVGTLLQALKTRRRWSNTIVLITSDHGEAFFEHNRLGHNSTVFDEMLQIPFILRLPPGFTSPSGLGLVTLADVLPTFVSAVDGPTPTEGAGSNLLAVSGRDPGLGYFVARTDREIPVMAIRTARWKLIRTSHNRMQLFDLVTDPEENTDVLHKRFPIAMGLERLLLQKLQSQPAHDSEAGTGPIDDVDAAMLRALGYGD